MQICIVTNHRKTQLVAFWPSFCERLGGRGDCSVGQVWAGRKVAAGLISVYF